MPRFFFHMATRTEQVSDENGKELRDLAAAHDHALHLIYRAMCSLREEQTVGWMIKVATEAESTTLTVLFPRRHIPSPFSRTAPLG
jgi:Domain of unknown function (DUF6894)